VETTLSSIHGIFGVNARLINETLGEATVRYNGSGVTLKDVKQAISTAGGKKHVFRVISVEEDLKR
jgi:hypothetical protein